jgi:hypothetical protein
LRGYIAKGDAPPPTHIANGLHKFLWDNLDPWDQWVDEYQKVRNSIPLYAKGNGKGANALPQGWFDHLKSQDPPKQLHGIKDIAADLGVTYNGANVWWRRPDISSRPPAPTHLVKGGPARGASGDHHYWDNLDPLREWYEKYKKKPSKSTQGGTPESLGQQDLLHLELPAIIPSFPHGPSVYDSGEQAKVKGPITVKKIPTCLECGTQHVGECW